MNICDIDTDIITYVIILYVGIEIEIITYIIVLCVLQN